MKKIILILLAVIFSASLFAQQGGINQNEAFMNFNPSSSSNVTIQRNTNFQTAIKIIENYSLRDERRNIVNLSSFNAGIPVQINNLPWKDALELLVKAVGIRLEARPGTYLLSDFSAEIAGPIVDQQLGAKMVRINATFFTVDVGFSRQMGINWNTMFNGNFMLNTGFGQNGQLATENPMFLANGQKTWRLDDPMSGTLSLEAFLNFLEETNRGSVLSRPSVTVLSGKEGKMQVGRDFSVKSLDQSGNTVENFYSAGLMLNATPTIISDEDIEAIHLLLSVEDSDVVPGALTTLITKSQTSTDVLLFDGEETVISGLIKSNTVKQRGGIPILKNLPWWVLGLKYIFGYNYETLDTKEVVVVVNAEIIDQVKERAIQRETIRQRLESMRKEFHEFSQEVNYDDKEIK